MTYDRETAVRMIAFFEGYQSRAKWDVNAYRLGFGSDTEGPERVKVTRGMTTTRERALANLSARVPEFEAHVVEDIGQEAWDKLGDLTRYALVDNAYNYGHLEPRVSTAVKAAAGISSALASQEGENASVNSSRRRAEAMLAAMEGM